MDGRENLGVSEIGIGCSLVNTGVGMLDAKAEALACLGRWLIWLTSEKQIPCGDDKQKDNSKSLVGTVLLWLPTLVTMEL